MRPLLSAIVYRGSVGRRVAATLAAAALALKLALLSVVAGLSGALMRRHVARLRRTGGKVWLDTLTFGPRSSPAHKPSPAEAADLTPRPGTTRVSPLLKRTQLPDPVYPFAWRQPPLSGDIINGLGDPRVRQADKVFHTVDYSTPWGGLEFYFHLSDSFSVFRKFLGTQWDNRHREGPVAPLALPVDDPEARSAAAQSVKAVAKAAGAALVGITEVKPRHVYAGKQVPQRYAISIAVPMEREAMLTVPSEEATHAVMDAYAEAGKVAIALAHRIRASGWQAVAATNLEGDASPVLHVPVAIDAGLGQLGKHGSLITLEHGSNVRLATVLTDLPLVTDAPVDLAVDDFCASCRLCVTNCPPHAIFDSKQTVRGVERWYVSFDTCAPYFSDNGGCGICIEVCPWSEPGRGPVISANFLGRREA